MLRHWRIIKKGRFQGGEFCDPGHAYNWAMRQVRGAFIVVETDRYGNLKHPFQLDFNLN